MTQQLTRETLQTILQAEDMARLPLTEIITLFRAEEGLAEYRPDGICQTDPRSGDRILFNTARARRPHDNRPAETTAKPAEDKTCVVCQGKTTGVIDVAPLSQGFTFINKNLFPVLYPTPAEEARHEVDHRNDPGVTGVPALGLHLLQWTSSVHDRDWHNMPLADRVTVLKRLAVLEEKLLAEDAPEIPSTLADQTPEVPARFISIFKNYGHLVGGSLIHGHQQIGLSNVMPRRVRENWQFVTNRGETFSTYLQRVNPPELLLKDYGPALLVVPYFMRRPFDMMLLMKNVERQYLHQLDEQELTAVAAGWHDGINVIRWIMPALGRNLAYNVITHNGPGAGLYFEFLPYTQEIGGFEHLGLFVCQGNPRDITAQIRQFLAS